MKLLKDMLDKYIYNNLFAKGLVGGTFWKVDDF